MSGLMCVLGIQTQVLDACTASTYLFSPETMSFLSTHACFPKLIGAMPQNHYHSGHSHLGRIIHLQCDIVAHH